MDRLHLTVESLSIAAALCRHFEGFVGPPYLCPGLVPSIGYGSTRWPDGTRVTLRDRPITREQAEQLLQHDLQRRFLPEVLRLCPTVASAPHLGALLSWTYNLGAGNLGASTMRRLILARQWDGVPAQMVRWVYADGQRLPGLVRRRRAEALVWADYERAVQLLPYL